MYFLAQKVSRKIKFRIPTHNEIEYSAKKFKILSSGNKFKILSSGNKFKISKLSFFSMSPRMLDKIREFYIFFKCQVIVKNYLCTILFSFFSASKSNELRLFYSFSTSKILNFVYLTNP